MLGHWARLVTGLAADPAARLSALTMLSEAEQAAVAAWAGEGTPTAMPAGGVAGWWTAQAARTPEAVALVEGTTVVRYAELQARVNQVAHYLRTLGVGPEVRVALWLERSVAQMVALLGVLQAGGAFVPLDPQDPPERVAGVLADAQAPVLITQARLAGRLPAERGTLVWCVDEEWGEAARQPTTDPASGVLAPTQAAYVVYTSGSTGRPKGVVATHGSVCALAAAQIARFGVALGTRVVQLVSPAFDAAVSDWTSALLRGGCLVLAPTGLAGPALTAWLREMAVAVAALPPGVLAVTPADDLPQLHTVVTGGEPVSATVAARWRAGRRLLNVYGTTEATVASTAGEVTDGPITIGQPLAHAQTYVVDGHDQPVPVGVAGELVIGGAGVARGYLHAPGVTAVRFVPDPWSRERGARRYRTGDRVRWQTDGQLVYLGRRDAQVKIRGYRVEPEEAAAALRGHGAVAAAVVVARPGSDGTPRLVGYVVPRAGATVTAAALRTHLLARLPEYLVPAAYVLLDTLPLTPQGKVATRALPAPEAPAAAAAPRPLRTPTEDLLAGLWGQVLGLPEVGPDDNFFDLGGHSLLATQVVSHVRRVVGVELDLRDLFDSATLSELAAIVDAKSAAGERESGSLLDHVERLTEEEVKALLMDDERPALDGRLVG
jgi:amino acid adenylation domain-containing protein